MLSILDLEMKKFELEELTTKKKLELKEIQLQQDFELKTLKKIKDSKNMNWN